MEWAIAEPVNHPTVLVEPPKASLLASSCQGDTKAAYTNTIAGAPHEPRGGEAGGYTIPEGSKVVVNAWWLANNPAWWDKPLEFRPGRFLEEERAVDAVVGGKVDFKFQTFGVGRKSCPGIILALPILGLILGKLVANFEMRPPPGVEKVDVSEKGGQFSLHIAKHSVVAFRPVKK